MPEAAISPSRDSIAAQSERAHFGVDPIFCPMERVPDLIRERAYQLFEAHGQQAGRELDDWLQAEREISYQLKLWERYEFKYLGHRFQSQFEDVAEELERRPRVLQSDDRHRSRRQPFDEMSVHE